MLGASCVQARGLLRCPARDLLPVSTIPLAHLPPFPRHLSEFGHSSHPRETPHGQEEEEDERRRTSVNEEADEELIWNLEFIIKARSDLRGPHLDVEISPRAVPPGR